MLEAPTKYARKKHEIGQLNTLSTYSVSACSLLPVQRQKLPALAEKNLTLTLRHTLALFMEATSRELYGLHSEKTSENIWH